MSILSIVLFFIAGVIIIGLIVWLLIVIFREREEIEDAPLILNFMNHYSDGYASGIEVDCIRKGDRYLIEYSPKDIDFKKVKEKKEIKNCKVVVDKNKVITLPKGVWSRERDIKILLPPTAEDFSDELKKHPFGQALMGLTEAIDNINTEVKVIREGSIRKDKLLKSLGDGEISEEWQDVLETRLKQFVKSHLDLLKRERETSFNVK